MRKVNEKSIVLGIGIGMIITAIAGMIFSAGNQKELSKAEIISLAKGYGLIEQVKFLNDNTTTSDSTNVVAGSTAVESSIGKSNADESTTDSSSTTAVDDSANSTDKLQQSDSSSSSTSERNISIKISNGFKSQDLIKSLLDKGVISSEDDFNAVLNSYKASRKINPGTFMFKKNDDLNYIVKTICKLK